MYAMYGGSDSVCPCCMGMVGEGTHTCTDGTCLHWGRLRSIYGHLKRRNEAFVKMLHAM